MRFFYESGASRQITLSELDKLWKTATTEWKQAAVGSILDKLPQLEPLKDVIPHAFNVLGADPRKSKFFQLLIDASKNIKVWNKQMIGNMNSLIKLIQQGTIKIDAYNVNDEILNAALLHASTYDRDPKEFIYSMSVIGMVTDESKLRRYFKNASISDVVPADLFTEGNELKPAGNGMDPFNEDTIYGVVERWAGKGHRNVKSTDKRLKDNKTQQASIKKRTPSSHRVRNAHNYR